MEEKQLLRSSVHVAMTLAAQAEKEKSELVTQTFRIENHIKELVEKICQTHGTTMSAFLRECCNSLVIDYLPELSKE